METVPYRFRSVRFYVYKDRRLFADLLKILQTKRNVCSARDRDQMNDQICGPARRHQDLNGVFYALAVNNVETLHVFLDEFDDCPSGLLADPEFLRGHAQTGGGIRKRNPKSLGNGLTGIRRSHDRARSGAPIKTSLVLSHLLQRNFAGGIAVIQIETVCSADQRFSSVAAGKHRSAGQIDRRLICRAGRHQLRRHVFIAAADQNHAVKRMPFDQFLRCHAQEVSVYKAGNVEKHLADRHGVDFQRKSARSPDAALYGLGQLSEMYVTGIGLGPGVNDADDRFFNVLIRIPHALQKRVAEHAGSIASFFPGGGIIVFHFITPEYYIVFFLLKVCTKWTVIWTFATFYVILEKKELIRMIQIENFTVLPLSMVTQENLQRIEVFFTVNRTCHVEFTVLKNDSILYERDLALTGGTSRTFLLLPVQNGEPEVTWQLRKDGFVLAQTIGVWKKAREWTLYVMLSSHTDIGLHNSQYHQRYYSEQFLQKAAMLCDATENRPESDRYRYTMEGSWFWENYPSDHGRKAGEEFVRKYIRTGKIGICSGIAGNHTQNYGFEEMCRAAYTREKLKKDWGIDSKTFTMIDNNGLSWAIVQPFAQAGYENLFFAPNQWNPLYSEVFPIDAEIPSFTWNPEASGGGARVDVRTDSNLPQLFWWEAQDGESRLLVWASAQYDHGGVIFGITPKSKADALHLKMMESRMPVQLEKLEKKYPLDLWLIASYSDDQEPSEDLTDLFQMWNAKWKYPRVRTLGDPDIPFAEVRERFGDSIPVLRGEITGGWYQHPAAAAELLARKLNADRKLAVAEKLSTAAALGIPGCKCRSENFRRAWNALLWHDEHSYGTSGYQGRRVYETWMQHRAWIEEAEAAAEEETRRSTDAFASAIPGEGICVFNPCGFSREFRVRFENGTAKATLPSFGYRVLPRDVFVPEQVKSETTQTPPEIENGFYRICFASDGSMRSIYDKELGKELLNPEREGANCLLYTKDNHKTFSSPKNAKFRIRSSSSFIEVTAFLNDPNTQAEITQRVTLPVDEKRIDVDNFLLHVRDMVNTNRYYRYLYYAFPFSVPNAKRYCQLNGGIGEYAESLTGHGTDTYMSAHEWCCAENDSFGTALFLRDTQLMEFDHIHPDKTDCGAAGNGSEMYNYVSNDWLQMHLAGGSHLNYHLRYAITSYAGNHVSADVARKAEAWLNSPIVFPLSGSEIGTLPENEASLLTVPEGVRFVGLKRAEDGQGAVAHFFGNAKIGGIESPFDTTEVLAADEKPLAENKLSSYGYFGIRLAAHRVLPNEAPKSASVNCSGPAPIGSVYTGLISRPYAARGENDGQLYLLWGANAETNLHHYELFRSEESGFTPDESNLIAHIPPEKYVVGRYIDEGLKKHTPYYYRVRAVNVLGAAGAFSDEFVGITKEDSHEQK